MEVYITSHREVDWHSTVALKLHVHKDLQMSLLSIQFLNFMRKSSFWRPTLYIKNTVQGQAK